LATGKFEERVKKPLIEAGTRFHHTKERARAANLIA